MRANRAADVKPAGVLVVDDSAYARTRLRRFLLERGFVMVIEAADGDAALESFAEFRPSLVLLDQVMRGRTGTETAGAMLAQDPGVHIVMLTVVTDRDVHEEALRAGVLRVLQKTDYEGLANALSELGHD